MLDGSFTYNGERYLYTPDPPHMLKLARNALSDYQVFIAGNGEKIQWRFIESLHFEQEKEGAKFGNKLSTRHILYHRCKMNVKLAAQTFSSSVAVALELLRNKGHLAFQGCEETIKFILRFRDLIAMIFFRGKHFSLTGSSKFIFFLRN